MFRVGIVGIGGISEAHIRGYLEFPEACEIVALADVVPGKAGAKVDKLGLESAQGYDSPIRMLDEADLDLVSITTPPSTHASLATAFLRRGVHVILEKPMAPSLQECDEILEAQRLSGALLSVVAQNRFRDDLATLHDAVTSGLAGPISHVRIDSAWWRGLPYYDLWWRGTWEKEGGGPTLNHAIHHIDLMLWLLGRPSEVAAMITNAQHENSEVEDLSVASLRYGRALAQLTSSVVHHGEDQQIVIQAQKARISQPWSVVAEVTQPNGFPTDLGNTALVDELGARAAAHAPLDHVGHAGQIGDVLDALATGREPLVTGSDGRNAVEVVTAIYKSAIEHEFVNLPLSPGDPYYRAEGLVERAPHFYEKTNSLRDLDGDIIVGASTATN